MSSVQAAGGRGDALLALSLQLHTAFVLQHELNLPPLQWSEQSLQKEQDGERGGWEDQDPPG